MLGLQTQKNSIVLPNSNLNWKNFFLNMNKTVQFIKKKFEDKKNCWKKIFLLIMLPKLRLSFICLQGHREGGGQGRTMNLGPWTSGPPCRGPLAIRGPSFKSMKTCFFPLHLGKLSLPGSEDLFFFVLHLILGQKFSLPGSEACLILVFP